MKKCIQINSIDQCNKLIGQNTLHPLISVAGIPEMKLTNGALSVTCDFYTVVFKAGNELQPGSLTFKKPGQTTRIDKNKINVPDGMRVLSFHPDLLCETPLEDEIEHCVFFSRKETTTLLLSVQEQRIVTDCLDAIQKELDHSIDRHSRKVIVSHLELLLNYCLRFYEWQKNRVT